MNKEIEGLSLYIGEHVVGKLDTVEKQTVKGLIDLLKTKYGRTRLEELEELKLKKNSISEKCPNNANCCLYAILG